ncbi:MAG: transporter substrate-binding domain-containing protein [Defluviitaleaceae bacterium]|nr:transporter substrate-binding domain-containing protein [Defluviitaleaceae bacterium]
MKRIIPKLFVFVVMAAMAMLLVACGGDEGDRPTLIMATSADFPPFEFINEETNEYDGFDIHMARALAEILDMDLRIDNMIFDGVILAVATGLADVGIAAISINEERLESVNFTIPYFQTTQVVIVQNASPITHHDQLENARIAVQMGTTSDLVAEWYLPESVEIFRFNMAPDVVLELNTGRVDAIVIDHAVANEFLSEHPQLRILEQYLTVEEYAIAVNQNDTELLNKLNDAIEQWLASPDFTRIYNMFFGGQ